MEGQIRKETSNTLYKSYLKLIDLSRIKEKMMYSTIIPDGFSETWIEMCELLELDKYEEFCRITGILYKQSRSDNLYLISMISQILYTLTNEIIIEEIINNIFYITKIFP